MKNKMFSLMAFAIIILLTLPLTTNAQEITSNIECGGKMEYIGIINKKVVSYQYKQQFVTLVAKGMPKQLYLTDNGKKVTSVLAELSVGNKSFFDDGVIVADDKVVACFIVNDSKASDPGVYVQVYDGALKKIEEKKIADLTKGTKFSVWGNNQDLEMNYDSKSKNFMFRFYFQSTKGDGLSYSRVIITDSDFNIVNQYDFAPDTASKMVKFPYATFLDNGDAIVAIQELSRLNGKGNFNQLEKSAMLYLPMDGSDVRYLELRPESKHIVGVEGDNVIDESKRVTYIISSMDDSYQNIYFTVYKYNPEKDEFENNVVKMPLSKISGNKYKRFDLKGFALSRIKVAEDGSVYALMEKRTIIYTQNGSVRYVNHGSIAFRINEDGEALWSRFIPNIAAGLVDGVVGGSAFINSDGDFGIMTNMPDNMYKKAVESINSTKNLALPGKIYVTRKGNSFRIITLNSLDGKISFKTLAISGLKKGQFAHIKSIQQVGDNEYNVKVYYNWVWKSKLITLKF